MIDNGASISILQQSNVPTESQIYEKGTIISGVGGSITSKQVADVTLHDGNTIQIRHRFHVLQDQDMPCHADGVLGLDFMRTYNAIIDLTKDELTLHYGNQRCVLRIQRSNENETCLSLPARLTLYI